MSKHLRKYPDIQERGAKLDDSLRSLLRILESQEREVTREGKVKDIGGIKGANLDYSLSFRNLTGDPDMTVRPADRVLCKHRKATPKDWRD